MCILALIPTLIDYSQRDRIRPVAATVNIINDVLTGVSARYVTGLFLFSSVRIVTPAMLICTCIYICIYTCIYTYDA